jgi:phosphoglycerate-specific signal transduction histidine kinase
MQLRKQGLKTIPAVLRLKLKRMVQMPRQILKKMNQRENLKTKREMIIK